MIKVFRNPNFSAWWNICIDNKLVDNAKTQHRALQIAERLKEKQLCEGFTCGNLFQAKSTKKLF